MKRAKRILGMVLSLCLVLSFFAGPDSFAEGENLVSYDTGWYSTVKKDRVSVSPDGIELPFNYTESDQYYELQASGFLVEQDATYRLTFSYKLPTGGSLEYRALPINASYGSVTTDYSSYKALEATGDAFDDVSFSFTIDNPQIARIELRFRTTKNAGIAQPAVLKNVSVVKHEGDAVTNGSFEQVDEEGSPKGTVGGELVTGPDAYDGVNMMRVTEGNPLELSIDLAKITTYVKLRGFIKAENFSAESKATVKALSAKNSIISEKSFNLAPTEGEEDNIWNIAPNVWEYVRMSGLAYSDGMKIQVSVTGAGNLYVDAFTVENDNNLIKNAAFVPNGYSNWAVENTQLNTLLGKGVMSLADVYTDTSTQTEIPVVTRNGNCPDGQNYIEAAGNGAMVLIRTTNAMTVQEGEKYRISVWLKTSGTNARIRFESPQTDTIKANYPGWNSFLVDVGAGAWKQVEFTLTVPKGMSSFNLHLRTQGGIDSSKKVLFNMPVVEKINEDEVGLYVQSFENAPSDAGGVTVVAPKLERYGYAFQNVLGSPLETATGFNGTITAVGITTAPQELSQAIVIIAAYKKDANGNKLLENVKVGARAAAPTWTTGVTDSEGNSVTGVNYPTVTLNASELSGEVKEIRAFLWDGVDSLRSVGKPAAITR